MNDIGVERMIKREFIAKSLMIALVVTSVRLPQCTKAEEEYTMVRQ